MTRFKDIDVLIMDNNFKWHKYTVNTYCFKDWIDVFDHKARTLERLANKGLIQDYEVST